MRVTHAAGALAFWVAALSPLEPGGTPDVASVRVVDDPKSLAEALTFDAKAISAAAAL
jgi:hypothetical protein